MSRQTQKRMPKIYVDYRGFVYSVLLKLCACCFCPRLVLFANRETVIANGGPVWFAIANVGTCLVRYR